MTDRDTHVTQVLLPIGEVARLAGVTVPTVRNWERDGKITAVRTLGGQRRFSLAEVQALLSPQSAPAARIP